MVFPLSVSSPLCRQQSKGRQLTVSGILMRTQKSFLFSIFDGLYFNIYLPVGSFSPYPPTITKKLMLQDDSKTKAITDRISLLIPFLIFRILRIFDCIANYFYYNKNAYNNKATKKHCHNIYFFSYCKYIKKSRKSTNSRDNKLKRFFIFPSSHLRAIE